MPVRRGPQGSVEVRRGPLRIDLHTHTTASDGRSTPAELVTAAHGASLDVIGVTDHDTMAGVAEVTALGAATGLQVVAGIEISTVDADSDVHVLGYFLDRSHAGLQRFLDVQRAMRVDRLRAIGEKLARLGVPVDVDAIITEAARQPGKSVGRPLIARALIKAGHVSDLKDAFSRFLGDGCAAFIPRTGATPPDAFAVIAAAGGIPTLAHPGATKKDPLIEGWVGQGLAALEVWHSEHDAGAVRRYREMARRLGLLVTGGSDYHGEIAERPDARLGHVLLPQAEFERLCRSKEARKLGSEGARKPGRQARRPEPLP